MMAISRLLFFTLSCLATIIDLSDCFGSDRCCHRLKMRELNLPLHSVLDWTSSDARYDLSEPRSILFICILTTSEFTPAVQVTYRMRCPVVTRPHIVYGTSSKTGPVGNPPTIARVGINREKGICRLLDQAREIAMLARGPGLRHFFQQRLYDAYELSLYHDLLVQELATPSAAPVSSSGTSGRQRGIDRGYMLSFRCVDSY